MLQGQLTTIGQQQSFDLGKWLNEEYIKKHKLISTNYSEDEIKLVSVANNRNFMTYICIDDFQQCFCGFVSNSFYVNIEVNCL